MSDSNNSKTQCPIILFAAPHLLHELRAIKVFMASSKADVGKMQPQVVKCREFIFTEAEVIGTPSPDITENSFYLIAHTTLMDTGRLQNRLSRVGLSTTPCYEVTSELYQSCLRYTVQTRLSPSWNRVGQWLVQGRDFLTHKGCANAVKMDITVVKDELYFTLEASIVKLVPLHVTDLDITPKNLEQFVSNTSSEISYDHIYSNWCYVLPSMKRGSIMAISHAIPEESPFKTYRDLKRHWKNMYGYRLPEHEEDIHFYQIRFGPFGGNLFTYPGVCLRGKELHKMPRIDQKPILRTFIQDLQTRIPTVCGCTLKLQSKAKFAVVSFCSGNKVSTTDQSNLTSKLAGARPSLYRTKSELETMFCNEENSTNKTKNYMNIGSKSMAPRKEINPPVKSLGDKMASQSGISMKHCNGTSSSDIKDATKPLLPAHVATLSDKSVPKIVPQFHSTNKRNHMESSMKAPINKLIPQKDSLSNIKQGETKNNALIGLPAFWPWPTIHNTTKTNTKSSSTLVNAHQQKTTGMRKSKPDKRAAEKTKDLLEKTNNSKKMKKKMKAES